MEIVLSVIVKLFTIKLAPIRKGKEYENVNVNKLVL